MRLMGAAIVVGVAAIASAHAQPADLAVAAERLLAGAYPADGPGAAVIVARGGQVLFAGGRGLADIGARRAITADTPVRLASVTKQFTAAVILQLVAEGRLSLDDPLSRFFPDWPPPAAGATVRQLLNHSSGLQDYTKVPGFMGSPPTKARMSTADLVAVMRKLPAVSPPGTRWEYNNGGYVMLGAIIEQLTGKPWHQAVVERIGRPLGMHSLRYGGDADAGQALGYGARDGRPVPAEGAHISVAGAAGGLVANARDLARWADALHHGRVVRPDLYRAMTTPAALTGGGTTPYGFGLRLRTLQGQRAFVHGGAGRGIDAETIYLPDRNIFVAVLANSDVGAADTSLVAMRLAAIAMGQPFPTFTRTPVAPDQVAALFGAYASGGDQPWRFAGRDGKFFLGQGDEELEAFAAGDDRFFFGPRRLMWFRFVRDAAGKPVLEVHQPELAEPIRAPRTGDAPPPLVVAPTTLARYVGTYRTEVPVLVVARGADGQLTIGPQGQTPLPLRAVSATEFRVENSPMRVVFAADGSGLTLYRGARELHGRRTD